MVGDHSIMICNKQLNFGVFEVWLCNIMVIVGRRCCEIVLTKENSKNYDMWYTWMLENLDEWNCL